MKGRKRIGWLTNISHSLIETGVCPVLEEEKEVCWCGELGGGLREYNNLTLSTAWSVCFRRADK